MKMKKMYLQMYWPALNIPIFKIILFLWILMPVSVCTSVAAQSSDPAPEVQWIQFEEAFEQAEQEDKTVILFMEADWCTYCKKMKKEVFPDKEVAKLINRHFYMVSVDIESDRPLIWKDREWTEKEFSQHLDLYATPTFVFMSPEQNVIGTKPGYTEKEVLMTLLGYISSGAVEQMGFEEYLKSLKGP